MSFNIEALPEQIRDVVTAIDKGDRIEVVHGYLEDQDLFSQIYDTLTKQFGGKYFGYYDSAAHYEIPKTSLKEPQNEDPVTGSSEKPSLEKPTMFKRATEIQKEESESEYDIKQSIPHIGYLYPVLKDAHGHVIDGYHRLQHDPNWPVKQLGHITNPLELAKARLVANVCRRDVPAEEKTEWLRQIASMTSWSAREIAEHLPVNYQWVLKYLPEEFKDKEKVIAGAKGGEVIAEAYRKTLVSPIRPKSEDTRQPLKYPVLCGCCGIRSTSTPKIYEGVEVCGRCFRELNEGTRQLPTPVKTKPKAPKVTKTTIPKTARDLQEQMHPQVSRMEEAILLALQEKGIHAESQKDFCVQSTRADFYLPKHRLAIYLDGEQVHNDPEKDQLLREQLSKRHSVQVLSLSYSDNTKQQQEQILTQIMEEISVGR